MRRSSAYIFLALLGAGVVYHLAEPGDDYYSSTQPTTGHSSGGHSYWHSWHSSGSSGSSGSSFSAGHTSRGGFGGSAGAHGGGGHA
jgi:hypothetical protein